MYKKASPITAIIIVTMLIEAIVGISSIEAVEIRESTQSGTLAGVTLPDRKAPIAISGDNVFIAWWSNKTSNDELLFRVSTDGGQTFSDKVNLSNTTDAESVDAEIAAEGENVVVTWWERNQTVNEPVVRISNDGGQTFGETLRLASNGTIGNNIE
jgi:hypothetical protein